MPMPNVRFVPAPGVRMSPQVVLLQYVLNPNDQTILPHIPVHPKTCTPRLARLGHPSFGLPPPSTSCAAGRQTPEKPERPWNFAAGTLRNSPRPDQGITECRRRL